MSASFRESISVRIAYGDHLLREDMRPRRGIHRSPLYEGRRLALTNLFNESVKTKKQRRFEVAYGAGRAAPCNGCTPSHSTRVCNECRNGFCTIPIDNFRSANTNHEHGCALILAKKCVKQNQMGYMVHGKLTDRRMARQSKLRGML